MILRFPLVLAFTILAASAQIAVYEMRGDLATGFDSVAGRLIVAGDQIVFLDNTQPQSSFVIQRRAIQQIEPGEGDLTVVQLSTPVRDRGGERTRVQFRLASASDRSNLLSWFGKDSSSFPAARPSGPPATETSGATEFPVYTARRDKMLGGNTGRLVIRADRLLFEVLDTPQASREWLFSEVREFRQEGPYRLEIRPFNGDRYKLDLQGSGMAREDFNRLVDMLAKARSTR